MVVLADQWDGCGIDLHQEILSADPSVGQWRTDAELPFPVLPSTISTDNRSIAMPSDDGILVIDSADKLHDIVCSAAGGDLGLPVLTGGGYLVTGGDKLYRVASDGSGMTADPLPAGYVAVAPTSDPNLFILAPTEQADQEYGLVGTPFDAYLWDLATGHLKLAARSVTRVDRSTSSLAYLFAAGGWLSPAADGSTRTAARPYALADRISPDGSRYIYTPDPHSTAVQTIELRESSTERALASIRVAVGTVAWNGNVAAIAPARGSVPGVAPATGSAAGAPQDLVILDGSKVTRLPLP